MGTWTDIAQWRGPTVNCGDGDNVSNESGDRISDHMYVVIHIAQGSYEGTISWQKNPDANVSSHFVVAYDGRIAQMVDTNIRAWTQAQGNPYSISIENEGFIPNALTPAQVNSNALILAKAHLLHGIPLQITNRVGTRGLGHHSMGAESGVNWGHSECPGINIKNQKPAILQRAIEIVNGDPDAMDHWQDPTMRTQAQRIDALMRGSKNYKVKYTGTTFDPADPANVTETNSVAVALDEMRAVIDLIATKVDLDPAELDAVKEAAHEGASTGVSELSAEAVVNLMKTDPEFKAVIVAAVNEAEDS